MRIHVAAAAAVIWLSDLLAVETWRWSVLILTIAAVISLESLNTAIERVGDMGTARHEPLARIAKDTAAAAVLTMALAAVLVAAVVIGPYIPTLSDAISNALQQPIRSTITAAGMLVIVLSAVWPKKRDNQ